ncbi:MAG: type III pantothenate kinase [Verrucomicrobiia bacterium]
MADRFLLVDIGNTNTDFGLATAHRILRAVTVPTPKLSRGRLPFRGEKFAGIVLASVVPAATRKLLRWLPQKTVVVSAKINLGIGVRYPNRRQIGADRLANAIAVAELYGTPAIVVDFGTALTFDVVNARREYVGGVIAPGLSAMTDYLYERTALLPHIQVREPQSVIGKSTAGAMEAGAVLGYRGLVKEILAALRREPGLRNAVAVATGGYAPLIARRVPGIQLVNPLLTLEGLRLIAVRNFM